MIKKWVLKAIVQKTISYLPFAQRINYVFQKYVTQGVQLSDAYFEDRLEHARQHITAWERYAGGAPPRYTLELGTGWYPVVPVALFLYGAEDIRTVDVTLLTDARHIHTTIKKFVACADAGKLESFLHYVPERMKTLRQLAAPGDPPGMEALTRALHIRYVVGDARRLPVDAASVDLIHSNNTFEHIYPEILLDILREFRRVARPGGLQSHFIDLSDHFAHFDPSITIYHFLRFAPAVWKWIDNSVQPLNRLRITDYRRLYREAGIPVTAENLRPGQPELLRNLPVHPVFLQNTPEENAVSHGYFFSKMP
ncbi:MAG: class I SAM-dependent methyltransferase [Saprospirales bacterium]|nr:class I SAM-dependent methyltransferase [Saprospirales bacterium]MBK8921680.1 class I SAM-dependent methyltransferase [Saprospirales bacterium]